MIRTVNFISGGGSTNLAVLLAEKPGGYLHGLAETVAIVSSDPAASGIQKAIKAGFLPKDILVVDPKNGDIASQLLKILDKYKPDYFHQLGWMPLTPKEVISRYRGLNQHLGPGGKWMYGVRRIYAHMLFCNEVGANRPIYIFCQLVAQNYDEGNVICFEKEKILFGETPEEAAERLLPVEHKVQIEALYRLETMKLNRRKAEEITTWPVPNVALGPEEEDTLLWAKEQARKKYPPGH